MIKILPINETLIKLRVCHDLLNEHIFSQTLLILMMVNLSTLCIVLFYHVQMLNPYVVIQVAENTILTAAAAVPILLAFAPMAVLVTTRSWVRTLQFLREPSLWAAVMNSVIWVLFAFIASKRVDCMELILSYPILLTLNFIYLLMVYGHYGKLWMVYNHLDVYSNVMFYSATMSSLTHLSLLYFD